MRRSLLATCALLVVCAAGCSSSNSNIAKPKELIVGKWELIEGKDSDIQSLILEFTPDGNFITSMVSVKGPKRVAAQYRFTADDMIEIETELRGLDPKGPKKEGKKETKKAKVQVSKDLLTITDLEGDGQVTKYKRK